MVGVRAFMIASASALCIVSANPLNLRATTTGGISTTPTAALIETTISGKLTTVEVGAPAATSLSSSSTITTGSDSTTASSAPSSTAVPGGSDSTLKACDNSIDQPICLPKENANLYAGNTYWATWNPKVFGPNTTIHIGLDYNNGSNGQVAWMSEGVLKDAGFTTITINKDWLEGWDERNVTLAWIAYSAAGSKADPIHKAYNVKIGVKPSDHLPPPARSKLPDKHSLLIGLPVALGSCVLIVIGLYLGMRAHRTIGLGSIMGRGKGYGAGKSRRQRLGVKKGAIRLEDHAPAEQYHDNDGISRAPAQPWQTQPTYEKPPHIQSHNRDISLGSLVQDEEPNAFRREIDNQRTGR